MRRTFFIAAIFFALVAGLLWEAQPASAIGSSNPPARSVTQDFETGKRAIYEARYDAGIKLLQSVIIKDPNNADAHNYIGFAYRKKGDLDRAARAYTVALRVDPRHKGALEYQGEMYLKLNNLTAAQANLTRLTKLCPSGCKERAELERAIADFMATQGSGRGRGS